MVLNKYAAALLQIAIVLGTAIAVVAPEELKSPATLSQLGLLVLGAILTFYLPLLSGTKASLLKTGASVLIAALTAVTPFWITGTITSQQIVVVVLAVLNALASELGVSIRKDAVIKEADKNGIYNITSIPETEKRLSGAISS